MPTDLVDTMWFFEIFLGGFITVWTFRYFSSSKEKYAEFEWFALSAFWGVVVVGLVAMFPDKAQLTTLFGNPFSTGFVASFFGFLFGYMGSRIARMKWFKWVVSYLGKSGEQDKSDKLF